MANSDPRNDSFEKYGMVWPALIDPLKVELYCIRNGGRWKKNGKVVGAGLEQHYRNAMDLLWSEPWHKWRTLLLESFCNNRIIAVLGPASSAKSHDAAQFLLIKYYTFFDCCTILVGSTEIKMLDMRIFGEIKKYHKLARRVKDWLPGYLIESKQMIVSDVKTSENEGRDFRNGICFPSETMIDTPTGKCRIDKIQIGQEVLNVIGTGKVTKVHRNTSTQLIRVKLSDQRVVDCTPEHPFLTERGWIKAIDLKTLDRVFSAHQNLPIMPKASGCRLSKSKVLQCRLSAFLATKTMRSMRKVVSPLESEEMVEGRPERQILQHDMRRKMGRSAQRVRKTNHCSMQTLRKDDEARSSYSGILLNRMPGFEGSASMSSVWIGIRFNSSIQNTLSLSLLQQEMQAKGYRHKNITSARKSNTGRINGMETISRFNFPLSLEDRVENEEWKEALVSDRYSIPGNQIGSGGRWRNSPHPIEAGKRQTAHDNTSITWVDSVEILEQAGDPRFNESEGGYTVYNLEVEGHPSYSVNGVLVHNCGVPYKKGQTYQGLSSMVGVKNKHVELVVDESALIPRIFVDAISNLNKNAGFHCIALGNPKDTTDALGVIAEPAAHLGGWDGGIDQTGGTKTWPNRFKDGLTVQLVGSDCPNMDVPEGEPPPFPFLITREAINSDIQFYGKDSLHFSMMNDGRMPRGAANRRVITRNMCLKFGAMEEPIWENDKRTKIGFLDAAYGGAGGDRTVFGELQFGAGLDGATKRQLITLIDTMVVQTNYKEGLVEDQIAQFIMNQCEQRGISPDNFFFDSTGRGSLVSSFGRIWSPNVRGIEFGGQPPDIMVSAQIPINARDYYDRQVTFLWYRCREVIEARQFRGMTEDVMTEGCFREWGYVGKNKIQVETKEKMKLKSGRSPDLFDALVAGIEGARQRGFVVQIDRSKFKSVNTNDPWKDEMKRQSRELKQHGQLAEL